MRELLCNEELVMYAVYLIVTGKKLGRIRWAEYVFHIDRKKNAPK